jgi:tRNA1(Val) A37 N6-methylase TrmN6
MKTRRPFRFKQFEVAQSKGCMPVTTDACIFGATIDLGDAILMRKAQAKQILILKNHLGINN